MHEPSGDSSLAGLGDTQELTHPAHVPSAAVATWLRASFITARFSSGAHQSDFSVTNHSDEMRPSQQNLKASRGRGRVLHLPRPLAFLVPGMHAQNPNLHKHCELSGRAGVWVGLARSDVQSVSFPVRQPLQSLRP